MNIVNVKDFLKGDGVVTDGIQKAIDSLGEEGGTVYFPAGTYITGTIFLKSNVTLYVDTKACILGSENPKDYEAEHLGAVEAPSFSECLIFAENADNIEIKGNGTIDGNGKVFSGNRPMLMRFVNCNNIKFSDIHLRNSGSWCVHMILCEKIHIKGVDLYNHAQTNNDGFDFDSCSNVFISDTKIDSSDDSICLKSTTGKIGENFVITNCILSSSTATLKLGTSSLSGWRNVTMSNCIFHDCPMGTIKIMMVDGGIVENVNINNIIMERVGSPLFIRIGRRNLKYEIPQEMDFWGEGESNNDLAGHIKNVFISNIQANVTVEEKDKTPIMIAGLRDSKIENVRISNMNVTFPGGGDEDDKNRQVAEDEYKYPEQWFFGVLPAYGMFARHVDGLKLHDVTMNLNADDARNMFYLDDVEGFINH